MWLGAAVIGVLCSFSAYCFTEHISLFFVLFWLDVAARQQPKPGHVGAGLMIVKVNGNDSPLVQRRRSRDMNSVLAATTNFSVHHVSTDIRKLFA